jgi:chromate transporter
MKKDSLYHNTGSDELNQENSLTLTESYTFTISRLFFIWLRIGFTSFGGGSITQYLIQENFIYKYKWITAEEYANIIAISQIAPGINILSYTILIGRYLAGWAGIFVSLLGLILPSASITVAISAIYTSISKFPRVHSALNTGFAAIFGISIATNWRNVKPILAKNRKHGLLPFGIAFGIMICSAIIYISINPSVIVLYLLGGLCGASSYWHFSRKEREE